MLRSFLPASWTNNAVFPGDLSYDELATPCKKRLSYIRASIVFPNSTQGVLWSVIAAFQEKLQVSARFGGHSYAASGSGGAKGTLVVDLSRLKTIFVNQSTCQAVIGTGNRLGDIAVELYFQGRRALPRGTHPYMGIRGHPHTAFGGSSSLDLAL
ncbi:uncharacterized protein MELLADRAFT_114738 [Melampsora larici-populina 98AG31]|uniref:FAD linked oxidase N-terminal domain-containing protein n=1 Tax=Melampsora larici-populina (strain 98AG31 / pathotype 3-4-7) TaxID=747676 RepID=F4SEK7_MELLP|nr:uncharacterized protein MELLADRAFT_114738 [Melampsora larici-populina 98AG31]EGF96920.1 hypothetical protein MELLADRAFT_114738 [Melampsora larici-populina 98AG31]